MARLPLVLTDIEGTTSSIHFVQRVLFPYARANLPDFVRANRTQPEVAQALAQAAREGEVPEHDLEAVIALLLRWIDEDRKATPLKTLQGLIWRRGYDEGAYRAHVYPDAVDALRRWRAAGHPIHVYSSGSIAAQRLYFTHTEHGDLSALFDGHFDTTIGGKREAASYARIAQALAATPDSIVFLTDIEAEADAAAQAGLRVVLVRREAPFESTRHRVVRDFSEIALD